MTFEITLRELMILLSLPMITFTLGVLMRPVDGPASAQPQLSEDGVRRDNRAGVRLEPRLVEPALRRSAEADHVAV